MNQDLIQRIAAFFRQEVLAPRSAAKCEAALDLLIEIERQDALAQHQEATRKQVLQGALMERLRRLPVEQVEPTAEPVGGGDQAKQGWTIEVVGVTKKEPETSEEPEPEEPDDASDLREEPAIEKEVAEEQARSQGYGEPEEEPAPEEKKAAITFTLPRQQMEAFLTALVEEWEAFDLGRLWGTICTHHLSDLTKEQRVLARNAIIKGAGRLVNSCSLATTSGERLAKVKHFCQTEYSDPHTFTVEVDS